MTREKMPNRRAAFSESIHHDGITYHVTVGVRPDGRLGEVFVTAGKPGSQVDLLSADIGILISMWLQGGGVAATALSAMEKHEDGRAAGPIGAILELVIAAQQR